MSVYVDPRKHTEHQHAAPLVRRIDDRRGTFGMALFITTEAMLFVMMFFTYFYLGEGTQRWQVEEPPKLHYAIPMLVILLSSSAILFWGEQQVKKQRLGAGKLAMGLTILLGLIFLGFNYLDFSERLLKLTPRSDAYGSIFFTITSLHGLHVCVGLLMLLFVFFMRRWEPAQHPPHRPYHNVAMYWHFVDVVWVFIVAILYVAPNVYVAL
jgi:heme/copper-type cytochrome/quinol oxidase subunit 3